MLPLRLRRLSALNGVIHFLFLCDMNSHQDLDGFDDALSVADQITIRLLRRRIFGKAREQPGKMQDSRCARLMAERP